MEHIWFLLYEEVFVSIFVFYILLQTTRSRHLFKRTVLLGRGSGVSLILLLSITAVHISMLLQTSFFKLIPYFAAYSKNNNNNNTHYAFRNLVLPVPWTHDKLTQITP